MRRGAATLLVLWCIGAHRADAEPYCKNEPAPPTCRFSAGILAIAVEVDVEKGFEDETSTLLREAEYSAKSMISHLLDNSLCLKSTCSDTLVDVTSCLKSPQSLSSRRDLQKIRWVKICENSSIVRVKAEIERNSTTEGY